MPVLRRLDLRGGLTRDTRGGCSDDLGSPWLTTTSITVQTDGTGVAQVDVT
jgi:hypothetical protein